MEIYLHTTLWLRDRRIRQLDSSQALVQAASRLEPYMAGSKGIVLKDTLVAQISALLYYKAHVVSKLTTNKGFQQQFSKVRNLAHIKR